MLVQLTFPFVAMVLLVVLAEPDTVAVLPSWGWLWPVVAVVTESVPVVVVAAQLTVKLVVAVPPEGTFAVWGLPLCTVPMAAARKTATWWLRAGLLAKLTLRSVTRALVVVPSY